MKHSSKHTQRGFWQWALPAAVTAFSALTGYKGQKDTNETNMQLGQDQMAFQREMSSTAYQRAVTDMKAAGLNPMLAYSQGGASAPQGAMPQIQNALSAGLSSASQSANTMQALQQSRQSTAQTELLRAETAKVESETIDHHINSALRIQDLHRGRAETANIAEKIPGTRAASALAELQRRAEEETKGAGVGFTADVKRRKAEQRLKELEIPEAQGRATFWQNTGSLSPYIRGLLEIIRGIRR